MMSASTTNSNRVASGYFIVSAEERCRYPSKFCCNRRTLKPNGRLHRFCEFHRQRANRNQRRWNHTRRFRESYHFCDEASGSRQYNTNRSDPPSTRINDGSTIVMNQSEPSQLPTTDAQTAYEADPLDDLILLYMTESRQRDGIRPADWDCLEPYGFVPTSEHDFSDLVNNL